MEILHSRVLLSETEKCPQTIIATLIHEMNTSERMPINCTTTIAYAHLVFTGYNMCREHWNGASDSRYNTTHSKCQNESIYG